MVRREPDNEICKMKVSELKYLAKQNNVPIKASDGKPKLKCDLMTDTIASIGSKLRSSSSNKSKTNKIFKPTSKITIDPKTKKSIKPTTKKSLSFMSISDDLLPPNTKFNIDSVLEQISDDFNECLKKYYKNKFRSLNKDEIKTIKKCYKFYKSYDDKSNDVSILASILIYYYITIKLSYRTPCITEFYKNIKEYTNDDAQKMVDLIYSSKSDEMTQIRSEISKLQKNDKSKTIQNRKTSKTKTRKTTKY